jgi:hypothetical protein
MPSNAERKSRGRPSIQHGEMWNGFRVRSPEGHLGFVDVVQVDPESGRAESFVVRAGRIIVLVVPVEEIEAVLPDERLILIDSDLSQLVARSLAVAA